MEMDDANCREIHKRVDECLHRFGNRLDKHSEKIDALERFQAGTTIEIRELCIQIKSLVSTVKWGGGLLVTTLVAFFVWYIQNL